MEEKLDLTSLTKAANSFLKAIDEYDKDNSNEFVQDSCIQRFEYCYDLSAKMIKRHLSIISANPSDINEMTFQQLIREAYTKGILKNSWDRWKEYRDNRNATSHGYDEDKAKEIALNAEHFYIELEYLLTKLKAFHED